MEVVRLASVESTSSHASALLAAGKPAPFAVWADAQTGGRGRRGATWASPPGNLYLTIVLPPPAGPLSGHGHLPLKAGVVVARFLQRHYGLRVTLKWPNDLLFGGRKLGGLLLEGSTSGDRAGCVLVGLGLNVASAPELSGPYKATSLAAVLGRPLRVDSCAQALTAAFAADWAGLAAADVAAAFEAFSIGAGHLWRKDGEPTLAHAEVVHADGGLPLCVHTAAGGEPLMLTSVDHGWRWLYLGVAGEDAPLAVADVGNTAVKLAWFAPASAAHPLATEAVDHGAGPAALAAALVRLAARAPASGWPLHILSVNQAAAAALAQAARAAGLAPLSLEKRPLLRHGSGYRLAELGVDRLAAIEGFLAALAGPARGDPAAFGLVVSAGTATTVDAVGADGVHLGGLILPGLATALASLHRAASLLPAVDLRAEAPVVDAASLGHDTKSAMIQAALVMSAGAVERVQRDVAATSKRALLLNGTVVTGGWGEPLARALGAPWSPDLVLRGARAMALGGWLPPDRQVKS